jgi:hypothetical protein
MLEQYYQNTNEIPGERKCLDKCHRTGPRTAVNEDSLLKITVPATWRFRRHAPATATLNSHFIFRRRDPALMHLNGFMKTRI